MRIPDYIYDFQTDHSVVNHDYQRYRLLSRLFDDIALGSSAKDRWLPIFVDNLFELDDFLQMENHPMFRSFLFNNVEYNPKNLGQMIVAMLRIRALKRRKRDVNARLLLFIVASLCVNVKLCSRNKGNTWYQGNIKLRTRSFFSRTCSKID